MISPKSIVLAALILPAIAILFFGPRPGADVPKDRVVVDYWEKWTGSEEAQMREIVDDFNNTVGKEQHVFVRYVSTSSINQKTLVAVAAGVPPDIAGLWDWNLVQYASQNALLPLEDMATPAGITSATYKPVFWDACNYSGHLYGLISTPSAVALHYNKTIFHQQAAKLRAAGLDPNRPPATIDELDAYAKALDEIAPDGSIVRAGFLPLEPGWWTHDMCHWFGGKLFDQTTGKFTFTEPHVVQSYAWMRSYSVRLGKTASSDFRQGFGNFDSPQNPFLAGTVVMEQQGPWMANYIYNLKPSMSTLKWSREEEMKLPLQQRYDNYDWAVAPFPTAIPGNPLTAYCGFDVLVIPRGARHVNEAFKFIAYVNRQDVMEKLCKLHCKNSPLEQVSDDFLNHHPNPYIKVFEDLSRSPGAFTVPKVPIWAEVGDELDQVAQKVTQQLDDPKTVLQEAQDRLQKKYDLWMEKQRARGKE